MPPASWPTPKSRDVGLFTDLRLFSEALELAFEQRTITKSYLLDELPQRVQGLLFIKSQSSRGVEHLIRELRSFGWFQPVNPFSKTVDNAQYRLTEEGRKAFDLFKGHRRSFLRLLTSEMHSLYTIPGWFVQRLWQVNPKGQGEVVIPAPPRDWRPKSKDWEDKVFDAEVIMATKNSFQVISRVYPGAFPIDEANWVNKVKDAWDRLSNLTQRKVARPSSFEDKEKEKMKTYAPRRRLAMAMREAAIKYLFSSIPPDGHEPDFYNTKMPLLPRTYMAWCPRLEALELLFYTDIHPYLPGRLLFPTSIFRTNAPTDTFERLESIKNPTGETLWLHRPDWEAIKKGFLNTLVQEHQRAYARVGSLYVPLLDVRDEVCRQLRLSALCFDEFIEKALRESIRPDSRWSISVETDIREDQRSAHRLIRRPVWINGTPHSLIAITEVREVERGAYDS